jgi:hypothetical protein
MRKIAPWRWTRAERILLSIWDQTSSGHRYCTSPFGVIMSSLTGGDFGIVAVAVRGGWGHEARLKVIASLLWKVPPGRRSLLSAFLFYEQTCRQKRGGS